MFNTSMKYLDSYVLCMCILINRMLDLITWPVWQYDKSPAWYYHTCVFPMQQEHVSINKKIEFNDALIRLYIYNSTF